ncbi:MAG: hypothetical protein OXD49_11620 [Candidatus Poribacteria bacterium]|nr:hypothetical protein [Candidatus Poribacteria bacterium]
MPKAIQAQKTSIHGFFAAIVGCLVFGVQLMDGFVQKYHDAAHFRANSGSDSDELSEFTESLYPTSIL